MSPSERDWRKAIRERLGPRDALPRESAYNEYWAPLGVPRAEVNPVLDLLETEYGLPGGLFRPEDALGIFLEPVPAPEVLGPLRRWWAQSVNSVRAGDRQLAMAEHLEARCRAHGRPMPRDLDTLGEFVRACAGFEPR